MTTINVNVFSTSAVYTNSNQSLFSNPIIFGGNVTKTWSGIDNQLLVGWGGLTGNDARFATPTGDISAFVTGTDYQFTVKSVTGDSTLTDSYTGFGNTANVVATETVMASGQNYHLDSFVYGTSQVGFNTMSNVTVAGAGGIGPIITGVVDVSISIILHDVNSATGFYRADFAFTAAASGGSLSVILPTSPISPLNVRDNGTMTGVTSQMVTSGNYVLVQVNASSTITYNFTMIAQLQWIA